MTRHTKKQRSLERYRRRCEANPAGEIRKFFREMVAKGYTTTAAVEDFHRRMGMAKTEAEATKIKTSFLLGIKTAVEADPDHD